METRVFRTNLSSSNCIANITPFLDKDPEIEDWEADLEHEFHPLRVSGEAVDICHVRELIREAGFDVYEEIPPHALTKSGSIREFAPILAILGYLGFGVWAASLGTRLLGRSSKTRARSSVR